MSAKLLPIPLLRTGEVQVRDFTLNDMQVYANANLAARELERQSRDAMLIDWERETDDPLAEIDAIYAEYEKSFGRMPDAEMARIVRRARYRLFTWWSEHREAIRSALVAASAEYKPLTDGQKDAMWNEAVQLRMSARQLFLDGVNAAEAALAQATRPARVVKAAIGGSQPLTAEQYASIRQTPP